MQYDALSACVLVYILANGNMERLRDDIGDGLSDSSSLTNSGMAVWAGGHASAVRSESIDSEKKGNCPSSYKFLHQIPDTT
jgi:hypothetical protein